MSMSRPKSAAETDIDIDIADILGKIYRYRPWRYRPTSIVQAYHSFLVTAAISPTVQTKPGVVTSVNKTLNHIEYRSTYTVSVVGSRPTIRSIMTVQIYDYIFYYTYSKYTRTYRKNTFRNCSRLQICRTTACTRRDHIHRLRPDDRREGAANRVHFTGPSSATL